MSKPKQEAPEGAGPLLERRYFVDIARPKISAGDLMQHIQCHVPEYCPDLLAEFEKTEGRPDCLHPGDEFKITILGPWNGEVRVTKVEKDFFEFVTLEGHPEAGRIRFALEPLNEEVVRFEIHSWARSRDGLVAFAYDTLGVGKLVQEHTWRIFCERVLQASGGQAVGPVIIETIDHDHAKHDVKQG